MKACLVLVFLASVVSCAGGTETDNPATLRDFSASACKTRETNPGQQGLVLSSDAEGLQCVEWESGSSGLQVRLLNFPEPCGDAYLGKASAGAEGLSLSVYKNSCQVFKCGWCVFDFEFELSGIDASHDLPVRIGSAVCESEPTEYGDQLTLPLGKEKEGVLCRYMEQGPLEWYGRALDKCGKRNMPCGDCTGADTTSCAAGLRCTQLGQNDSRCLQECTSDDDCSGGLTTCQDGVCQPGADW